jgi:hypothetical protein
MQGDGEKKCARGGEIKTDVFLEGWESESWSESETVVFVDVVFFDDGFAACDLPGFEILEEVCRNFGR